MKTKIRDARVEEIIIYKELIGTGIEEDPYRELLVVYAKDGSFIAENDPQEEIKQRS